MSLYARLVEHAEQGGKYYINLGSKTLRIGNEECIYNGNVLTSEPLIAQPSVDAWERLKELYYIFRHSVPRTGYKDNSYFVALKYEDLTLNDLACGESREVAQAMFEGFVLLASIEGYLQRKEEDKWFWQDPDCAELVVLREWIINFN